MEEETQQTRKKGQEKGIHEANAYSQQNMFTWGGCDSFPLIICTLLAMYS